MIAEWIGQFIANWPLWAIVIALIIASLGWFFYYISDVYFPMKHEWPEDKKRRLAKKQMKVKKG